MATAYPGMRNDESGGVVAKNIWTTSLARGIIAGPDGAFTKWGRMIDQLEPRRMLSAGDLNTAFGTNGVVDLHSDDFAAKLALTPDGKLLVLHPIDFTGQFKINRYNRDGSLDTTFGTNGEVTRVANGQ